MEIQLRAAQEIPPLFIARLGARATVEAASVTTYAIERAHNPLLEQFIAEAKAFDTLAVDNYGYLHGACLGMPGREQKQLQQDFPGNFVVLNQPEGNGLISGSFLKRSHIKAYSVGNRILSAGGVNCTPYSFDHTIDLMADFESAEYADWLAEFSAQEGDLRSAGQGKE